MKKYKYSYLYRITQAGEDSGWYTYSEDAGEQYLAPITWTYIRILSILGSAGWKLVGKDQYNKEILCKEVCDGDKTC